MKARTLCLHIIEYAVAQLCLFIYRGIVFRYNTYALREKRTRERKRESERERERDAHAYVYTVVPACSESG